MNPRITFRTSRTAISARTFTVTTTDWKCIAWPPDGRGFVKDFAEMDAELAPLIKKVDHRLLNDVEGLENPTAEIIAAWFFERITDCESVRVYENDECWAEVKAD